MSMAICQLEKVRAGGIGASCFDSRSAPTDTRSATEEQNRRLIFSLIVSAQHFHNNTNDRVKVGPADTMTAKRRFCVVCGNDPPKYFTAAVGTMNRARCKTVYWHLRTDVRSEVSVSPRCD